MLKAAQLLLVFLVFFLPSIDTDLGWHLRYGDYFLQTGQILRENSLTYFMAGYGWAYPYLAHILTSLIYKFSGLLGLSFAYGMLGALAFWVFNKINPPFSKTNLLAFLGLVLSSWTVFSLGWRAQFFSFLGLIIVFFLLKRVGYSWKVLLLFPPLFIVWANLHGGFVLGLVVLGLATIQAAITAIPMCQANPHRMWKCISTSGFLAIATLASAAVVLINPFGIDLYKEALRHAQYPLGKLIAEWVPPNTEIQILIAGITITTLLFIVASHNVRKLFWVLVLVFFTVLALQARRNLPFFGLVAALAILETFQQKLVVLEQNAKFQRLWPAFLGSGIIVLLLFQVPRTLAISTNLTEWCSAREIKMPCRAIEYVRAHSPEGQNVFAAYEWGGFLEWQLPQYKYFVDGRMPAWVTPSPYTSYLEIIQARPGWEEKLDIYGTDWLLIGTGTFLDLELQKNKDTPWKEQYRDNVAVIYTLSVVK